MFLKTLFTNNLKYIFAFSIVLLAVLCYDKLKSLFSFTSTVTPVKVDGVFTQEQLAQYDGIINKKLYLALLGSIFDVTKGKQHYKKGSSYNYFVGKDGSRAFVTGDFQDEGENRDHILDLTCDQLSSLQSWKDTFKSKYKHVGVLMGRYYNENGEPTQYFKEFKSTLNKCESDKEIIKKEEQKFPPCNVEWSAEQGSRVWCTTTSGGISRSWTGVPRQLFTPGEKLPRCACVNLEIDHSAALLKEYDNCPPTSTTCAVNTD